MDPVAIYVGAAGLVVAGVVSHVVTVAVVRGSIGVNALVGLRTRRTMASPEAWVAAHRGALQHTRSSLWISTGCALVGAAAYGAGDGSGSGEAVAVAVLGLGYVGFVVLLLLAVRAGHRAIPGGSR